MQHKLLILFMFLISVGCSHIENVYEEPVFAEPAKTPDPETCGLTKLVYQNGSKPDPRDDDIIETARKRCAQLYPKTSPCAKLVLKTGPEAYQVICSDKTGEREWNAGSL